ncbi:prefoldin, alpha subunit [Candidatus Nitrosopumilus salaria BD31]|jgi:prefoldin alpha subunit|uniref:Prefoldin subunit alpha n=1 Tax=Candidatus Nitrosopumilus salarius BD31 TaxID=859350 RepID=I3D3M3_9ARCH|nr:prefoldin subunit alpha [Candidatus Nitrosopumilus salaria]EIJ66316.1 prefoldin, alpha subunit [Candidatus Nitrosopumilus salaria BD31]
MSEEQAEQLMQQMQMLETYFSDLSQREATFVSIFRETIAAIESIKSLSQKTESETLVPIGMGTYLPTKISSNSKIVLNIGAGVAVEKDFPSAINYLEARIKEIEIAINDTAAKKQDAAGRLEQGKAQINQLMQSMSPPKSG